MIKNKLTERKATVGSWMQIPSPDIAEIMGKSGYDWIVADLEHGRFSNQMLPDIFRAIQLGGAVPFARIAQAEQKDIKEALDAGAMGIIYPMIESADQLRKAISYTMYPPEGKRGIGFCRANLFGTGFAKYFNSINDSIVKIAQIEHINGVNDLDSILEVKGLDGIIIGPYDLSGSLGITGEFDNPLFTGTIETIRTKTQKHDIPMGIHIVQPDPDILNKKIEEGYTFIAYGIDAIFLSSKSTNPVTKEI